MANPKVHPLELSKSISVQTTGTKRQEDKEEEAMKKDGEKPSGLEIIMSLVLTFFSIAIVSFVGACVIGYYTCSIKNALIALAVGLGIASLSASVKFWVINNW